MKPITRVVPSPLFPSPAEVRRGRLLETLEPRVLMSATAVHGYTVTTFATAPAGSSQPDSIVADGSNVFVGYQNGGAPDGSGGATSTIVEYSATGAVERTLTVAGHNDGLKVDPATHLVWAMQNEDANPNLVIIDPTTGTQTLYSFAAAPLNGGGYDDIAFVGGNVYFSESNPSGNPNTAPAIVQATLSGTTVNVSTVLLGNATYGPKKKPIAINLQDPDSMTVDRSGDLVMTSQADNELVIVKHPGNGRQSFSVLPLSDATKTPVSVDDTLFVNRKGTVLVSDTKAGVIYAISGKGVKSGLVLSAAPDIGDVGITNGHTGRFTPIITGLSAPHGLTLL